jgi:trans-aconitate methyltransferase
MADHGPEVIGLDRNPEMIDQAATTHPEIPFLIGDGCDLPVTQHFDAVFSNAVLHWIDDQETLLAEIHRILHPGGRYIAELGAMGNVSTIINALMRAIQARSYEVSNPWYFPSLGEYSIRLERHGFEITYARLFDRPTKLEGGEAGLRKWLDMFFDGFFADVPEEERNDIITEAEADIRDELFNDGDWWADYRRLRFIALREGT